MSEPESRIALLGNGLDQRQKKKLGAQNATLDEVKQALVDERPEIEEMVKWYMRQVPGLMAHMMAGMLADFATQNGLTFVPPAASVPPVDAKTSTGDNSQVDTIPPLT